MIRPMDARVIVEKPPKETQTAGGIILPDAVDDGKQTEQGIVVEVGPGSRNMNTGFPMPMNIKKGERIIYTKFSATEINYKGKEYFVVTERDIVAVIDDEE